MDVLQHARVAVCAHGLQACGNRTRYGMVGLSGQRQSQGTDFVFTRRCHKPFAVNQLGTAMCQRAGLVQRHGLEQPRLLQMNPALEQQSASRAGRQRTDDGHRRGNHQSTGAADHQQHQRLVDGIQPTPAEQQRATQGHCQRQRKYQRRVHGGKAIDKALRRRAAVLGFFHRMDDAGQRGVLSRGRAAHLQHAGTVDGAGKHAVARPLVHRNALAGDGRLVDRAVPRRDHAIQRDALAGLHPQHGTRLDLLDGQRAPLAIGLQHIGLLRGQLQQLPNGIACACR